MTTNHDAPTAHHSEPWHLLQVSDVLDIEFGSALAEQVPLIAWEPARTYFPWAASRRPARTVSDPPLHIRPFSLMRGYARFPLSAIANTGAMVAAHLARHTHDAKLSPLICTTPYLAPVAERWPGPVIYWLSDRIEKYAGVDESLIHRLDERMCRAATLVCPNSVRIADYLSLHGHCSREKLHVLPNATRQQNLLPSPPLQPAEPPADIADLPRPIAGIIGNLAGNMDWLFVEQLMSLVPQLTWAFVGPTTMAIEELVYSEARNRVMASPQARFVGRKPYGELASYARAFDVAILPYRLCEPTYSGSSTRFYEHLAACRPMIASKGFAELLLKEPLVRTVNTAEEAARLLEGLIATNFDDQLVTLRWAESQHGTWQARARTMREELAARWNPGLAIAS